MNAPAPLYRTDLVELYCADARDVLPELATESVDLVVTDPPYGVEWQSNRRAQTFDELAGDGGDEAARAGIADVLEQAVRLVGQNRHLYVFGPSDVLAGALVSERVELVWHKARPGLGDLSAAWAPAHELITFTTSKHRHAGEVDTATLPARLRKGSVLTVPPATGTTVRHPTEKPVELLAEFIESSSRPGELVLDPFAGSGSTGVAAVILGRRAVLCEVDTHHAATAIRRLERAEEWRQEVARL